jgi:hypothetical protein
MPNIRRGSRVGGLLRYLYGPGRREEHVDPHLVAAWDGAGTLTKLEPAVGVGGRRDFRMLIDMLEQPVRAGRNPPDKHVWHCSLRTAPSDRVLPDLQWAHIAGEVMAQVGLAPHADPRGVRWVAMRHGPDHIHIVATLVRQDRRTDWARNDRWKAQAACRNIEERYGLYRVGPADRTSHRRPHAVEVNKALRTGRRETGRDQLRREVRFAAAAAASLDDFVTLLREAGMRVKLRASTTRPGEITGYAVASADHTTATGQPVWFGGGRLAPDLTLPKLRRRWATGAPRQSFHTARPTTTAAATYQLAAEQVRAAVGGTHERAKADPDTADSAGMGAADLLTVVARQAEGDLRGPLHRAAEAFDRAIRVPYGGTPARNSRGDALRAMARLLCVVGAVSDDQAVLAMLRLILTLSALADSLAQIRESQQRRHQARAARTAARLLRSASRAYRSDPARTSVTAAAAAAASPPGRHRDRRRAPSTTVAGRDR